MIKIFNFPKHTSNFFYKVLRFKIKMRKKLENLFKIIKKIIAKLLNNIKFIPDRYNNVANSRYGRLIRMDSYHVYPLLFMPTLWAIWMADESGEITSKLIISIIFILGAFLTRSIGCIINDIADRNLDKVVERTKSRPIASGEVSVTEAASVAGTMTTLAVILLLSLPTRVIYIGIIAAIMILIYPLSKRFTNLPQVILGFTFNLGVLIAWLTVNDSYYFQLAMLYLSAVNLTVGYDTVYACQDIEYDKEAGIKSFPLFIKSQGREIKPVVWHLYKVSMACLGIAGLGMGMGLSFYLALGAAGYMLYNNLEDSDLNLPSSCASHFKKINSFLLVILLGIIFN